MNTTRLVTNVETWPIDRLVIDPANARTHSAKQIQKLAKSISKFGFVNPILVGPDDVIVAGHARLAAAQRLHLVQVPVIVLGHLTGLERRALAIADNRLAEDAGWNDEMLRATLAALRTENFDLALTGLDDQELERLAKEVARDPLTDEDAVPSTPPTPASAKGDLWIAGVHRILCGDATIRADSDRLMAGDPATLVFIDPPYNVDYQGYTADHLTIPGDRMSSAQFQEFLQGTFERCRAVLNLDGSLYICHASSWQREVQNALEQAGFAIRCQIIWAKNTFAWGFARYKFQHEPLFYCHIAEQKDVWYGDRSQSTLWQENKPAANRQHPTAKPVELVERAIVNSSRTGDVVVDLFGGSGSTLIACQRLQRKARLAEIDPHYTDVIVERWQQYTGEAATLDGDGRSYAEIAEVRRGSESSGNGGETAVEDPNHG